MAPNPCQSDLYDMQIWLYQIPAFENYSLPSFTYKTKPKLFCMAHAAPSTSSAVDYDSPPSRLS